jgi:hypothetical protein
MLDSALSTRGWEFQDHQLSTRIVHFTKIHILWGRRAYVAYEEPSLSDRLRTGLTSGKLKVTSDVFGTWRLLIENRRDIEEFHGVYYQEPKLKCSKMFPSTVNVREPGLHITSNLPVPTT